MDPTLFSIINSISASIYWKDLQGRYLGCNNYMLEMSGLECLEDILGKTDFELPWVDRAKIITDIDKKVLATEQVLRVEERPIIASGEEMIFLTTKTPLYENGQLIGIIGVSQDIKDIKILEQELKANQLKNDLLSNVCQEISDPLQGILLTETVLTDTNDAIFIRSCANEIVETLGKVRQYVSDTSLDLLTDVGNFTFEDMVNSIASDFNDDRLFFITREVADQQMTANSMAILLVIKLILKSVLVRSKHTIIITAKFANENFLTVEIDSPVEGHQPSLSGFGFLSSKEYVKKADGKLSLSQYELDDIKFIKISATFAVNCSKHLREHKTDDTDDKKSIFRKVAFYGENPLLNKKLSEIPGVESFNLNRINEYDVILAPSLSVTNVEGLIKASSRKVPALCLVYGKGNEEVLSAHPDFVKKISLPKSDALLVECIRSYWDDWALKFELISPKILLIEDNLLNCKAVVESLKNIGCHCSVANTARQAIDILNTNRAIDLVISDIVLPDGNIQVLLQTIKEMRPNTPIVAVTAFMVADDLEDWLASMDIPVFIKPLLKEHLINLINDHI